ncbi:uncharacterized protein GIQ15_01663 [Arthroderma uncinatum]|uniref:uncharacterized protein n=1 Tax=Arthroderma uncinatum TaxID=74035 RepID=UPI00144A633D|nr:uncharacterized protein GIQ15_01663 [Arthroderma uncinatum]KAF3492146.1 hypothetical protein GIQ15_01663 [Arthroderma uncinatum]
MRFVYTACLYLLAACKARSAGTWYLDYPMNANFTILDHFNNDVVSPGGDGIIEVKPNTTHRWLFEYLYEDAYIIRDSTSHRFIYFPEIKEGAVATVSEKAATVLHPYIPENALGRILVLTEGSAFFFTVGPYSPEEPNRRVIKLVKNYSDDDRQFSFIKKPKNGN